MSFMDESLNAIPPDNVRIQNTSQRLGAAFTIFALVSLLISIKSPFVVCIWYPLHKRYLSFPARHLDLATDLVYLLLIGFSS